jgi:predicted transcriptional regulator
MIAANIEIIDNTTRKKNIVKYIKDNPGCNIQDIVKDGLKNGYGAKKKNNRKNFRRIRK